MCKGGTGTKWASPVRLGINPDQARAGRRSERLSARLHRAPYAFTLLEVILALAILGFALATLGQASGRSHGNARRAADESELAVHAESVLDELLCGLRELAAIDREPIADAEDPSAPPVAVVSIGIENGPLDGLLVVRVRVDPAESVAGSASALDAVELVQWIVDPSLSESSGGGL
ncbi:hypothetical protein MalM25_16390 [Planctomycetes bacterium MalM25]|nr:hypothetical protein MalM25_16390 [Planctomycetes bacterium MalM25]